jgi:REP element-mobilizing transposase RayT
MDQVASGHAALRRGRVSIPHTAYLITTTTHQRQPVFSDFRASCAASRCFEDNELLSGCRMLAWVLMPDHAHWLVQLGSEPCLERLVNRIKSASARLANRNLGRHGPLWAPAFHDRALRREEDLREIARYLVANPIRAGLVRRIGDYPFWNTTWI